MGRKLAVVGVGLIIIIIFISAAALMNSPENMQVREDVTESKPYVQTQIVSLGSESADIISYGRVVPNKKLMLYSEVPGKILTPGKSFKVGVSYKANEAILNIDSRELEYSLKTQRAEMLSLLTSIMADIRIDYPEAYPAWSNYLSEFDIDKILPPLPDNNNGQLKLFLSGKGLFKVYYSIKNAEVRLDKYVITSPYAGTLTMAIAEPGMIVAPGQKLGELSSAGSYEVEIGLSDNDLDFAPVGTKVLLKDNQTNKEWEGRIVRIAQNVDSQTQTVRAFVSMTGSGIKEGMYLTAWIDGTTINNVEKIDRNAIVDNNSVFLIKNGKLDKKQISIAYKGVESAYIRDIENGDTIVTLPPSNLPLGTSVDPMPSGTVYDRVVKSTMQEDKEVIEEGL